MSRDVLSIASEKGTIVVNECLRRWLYINTLKLEQLLILIQGRMLSLYNRPFFSQDVIARTHALMIDEVDKEFRINAIEFKEEIVEYVSLLSTEEEVMNFVLDSYGSLNVFELQELYELKILKECYSKEGKDIKISKEEIQKVFIKYLERVEPKDLKLTK